MGRGKIEIKKIENPTNRQVTFSKRRGGLIKKAHELGVLCDAQVGLIVFSSTGKLFEYSNPHLSMPQIIERYQRVTNTRFEEIDNHQLFCEMTRMRSETEKLEANMKLFTGEELSSLTMNDLDQLEEQLEYSANKVRSRKHQLLHQQLENLRRKEHILEDQHGYLCRMLSEQQQQQQEVGGVVEHKVGGGETSTSAAAMLDLQFGHFFSADVEEPSTSRNLMQQLQLTSTPSHMHTFRLQPTQPNLQDLQLHGHGHGHGSAAPLQLM